MAAAMHLPGSLFARSVSGGSTDLAPSKGDKLRGISDASTSAGVDDCHYLPNKQSNLASGAHPTATFANNHLIVPSAPKWCAPVSAETQKLKEALSCKVATPLANLSSGAYPTVTFPNSHLVAPTKPNWCKPLTVQQQLYKAVQDEDWEGHFMVGRTHAQLKPDWTASPERCATLQQLVDYNGSRRVLEVGSFCGASSLALAEALPEDGEVRAVEKEPLAVDLGKMYQSKSAAGSKINTSVRDAKEWLDELANKEESFDLVLIDADKDNMKEYVDTVLHAPGLLAPYSLLCVDITRTCQQEIEAFRTTVALNLQALKIVFELQGLLVLQQSVLKGIKMEA
mmetsp:Transcript_71789/g.126752  ORF Transcript_71789/g.126752 Transcript_71789/m.126752 type:complete len:340 (+) Transcript_71789:88-1107(+)